MRVTTFVLALMLPPVAAGQTVVTPEDRTDLGLTVYEGFTHVREVRSIDLGEGTETVVWTPVPDGLDPGTLTLHSARHNRRYRKPDTTRAARESLSRSR